MLVKRYFMEVRMSNGTIRTFDQRMYDESEASMKAYNHSFDRTFALIRESDSQATESRRVVETETPL